MYLYIRKFRQLTCHICIYSIVCPHCCTTLHSHSCAPLLLFSFHDEKTFKGLEK